MTSALRKLNFQWIKTVKPVFVGYKHQQFFSQSEGNKFDVTKLKKKLTRISSKIRVNAKSLHTMEQYALKK
jgi:hypothetical protein